MKQINDIVAEVHENAKAHGWWDGEERTFGELIALCHSELSEALEEYRNGKPNAYYRRESSIFPQYESLPVDETDLTKIDGHKPEGIAIELADCVIRIMDMCGHYGIDLEQAILVKHAYNKTRAYKHGGKVI